ncbi:hypothetical protein FQN54_000751 [Arachnomyces sp. PD_36]|nr:hypothetical protein FQN54_000751 [Arachnomyces sp. PD_36]
MPRSLSSRTRPRDEDQDDDTGDEDRNNPRFVSSVTAPPSPDASRPRGFMESEARIRFPDHEASETTSLLGTRSDFRRSYSGTSQIPRPDHFFRNNSTAGSVRRLKNHSRASSQGLRFGPGGTTPSVPGTPGGNRGDGSKSTGNSFLDERVWYDQFTSTDWVHDSIADGMRVRELRARKDIVGRLWAWADRAQGWVLAAFIGCITAIVAYFVDITESSIFDLKEGFCTTGWFQNKRTCCLDSDRCPSWRSWSQIVHPADADTQWINFVAFVLWAVVLSSASCYLTLFTKTVVPSNVSLATLDEDLGAEHEASSEEDTSNDPKPNKFSHGAMKPGPPMVYYSAAGSGVAEVKVILSGFVLHGYLGLKTLVIKTFALILSVSSGLSVGKEGPYVHIATAIGNISCRLFSKYNQNDGKRREMLSASAASGVGVAFGAPIGGVLFSLEEVSYYFSPKRLFRTFFCCIVAALSLKFLNPYGTGKIVLFEVRYTSDWEIFEMVIFVLLGALGGALGALFIKATRLWAKTFRRIPFIKRWPMLEVVLVALVTGLSSFWNRHTQLPVTELLFELASPCDHTNPGMTPLCPDEDSIPEVIRYLLVAFVIKSILTTVTFGIKLPAGIYVPSMVVGGLLGRTVGHMVQYWVVKNPDFFLFGSCPSNPGTMSCVTPGIYAMIAAGATMCGVTRLSMTLAVILFELTGSLNHVLPFSLAILCAKWTADALEPLSIYDLLIDMNSYPFLDNKMHPVSDTELGDIVPRTRKKRRIDVSDSPLVPASELRDKLNTVLMAGELDGGLPILRNNVLVGLIPAPDLEFALDKLGDNETSALCLMSVNTSWADYHDPEDPEPVDFTPYIDPAPVALDIHSPIDLVYQCFVKLGLRYMCVLQDGKYAGLVHKKTFVKFMKEIGEESTNG